jgi:hypothetical protein
MRPRYCIQKHCESEFIASVASSRRRRRPLRRGSARVGGGFDVVNTPRDTSVRPVLSALFFVVREDE